MLVHEQKLNQQEKEELALKATTLPKSGDHEKGKWKEKNVNNKKEKNKVGDSQNKAGDSHGKEKRCAKSHVECFHCHRYSYYRSECRINLNKNHGRKSNFTETREDI